LLYVLKNQPNGDVNMTTHMNFQEWNKVLDNISYSKVFHLEFDPLKSYHWSSTKSQIIVHKFSFMAFGWILMDEIKFWMNYFSSMT
jgi:hypothetical protein